MRAGREGRSSRHRRARSAAMNQSFDSLGSPVDAVSTLTRRRLLVSAAAVAAAVGVPRAVRPQNDDVIRLGQTIALTGPLADIGMAMHRGSKVAFDAINAQGGVHGRRIELVA